MPDISAFKPEILAPAGNKESFLAAVDAGADAVYCGLKHFSARMEADNFALRDLSRLQGLAQKHGTRTYVALNTLIKPNELDQAGRLLDQLTRYVHPDALIIQDPAALKLARQVGFTGELHFSTLANIGLASALPSILALGADRVVLPRELTVDEIKTLDTACPDALDLEVFVHGALCYAVSGRCYWSSYLGGKSGLRGRCVQPCRRIYTAGGPPQRLFSCQDLGLDILTKALLEAPRVKAWKIEGRKKGPHYVTYTVRAYALLRDNPLDPQAKKEAVDLLDQALSRPTTHYSFLPQRPHPPVTPDQSTASGGYLGRLQAKNTKIQLRPHKALLPQDLLRIGYEDEPGHRIYKVSKYIPKGGLLTIQGRNTEKQKGMSVFLIDRREPELVRRLKKMDQEFQAEPAPEITPSSFTPTRPGPRPQAGRPSLVRVYRNLPPGKTGKTPGLWVQPKPPRGISSTRYSHIWWWLPPVLWPEEERLWQETIDRLLARGAKRFVLNAPWQVGFFNDSEDLMLWAGPFCNLANALALESMVELGFSGAFASPELAGPDLLALPGQSPLPMGLVLGGAWPFCLSRVQPPHLEPGQRVTSPKKEISWTKRYGPTTWHYPNWDLDLYKHQRELEQAGYTLFAHLYEPRPKSAPRPHRTSTFNWDLQLL